MYIDKRAISNKRSTHSLIPYVNLNQLIQQIVSPHTHDFVYDDICYSTKEIGDLDISELNGQYFVALDQGEFSTSATLEEVAKSIPPCKFKTLTFSVSGNTADEDIVVWLLSGEDIIGSVTINDTGDFSVTGDASNLGVLSICINITGGAGIVSISEIITTFSTSPAQVMPPK